MLDTFRGRLTAVIAGIALLVAIVVAAAPEPPEPYVAPVYMQMVPPAPSSMPVEEQRRRGATVVASTIVNLTGDLTRETRPFQFDRQGGMIRYNCESGQHVFLYRPVPNIDERSIVILRLEGSTSRAVDLQLSPIAHDARMTAFAARASLALIPRVPRPAGELRVLHGYLYTELAVIARDPDGRNARVLYRDRDLHMTDAMHRCAASQGRALGQRPPYPI